MEGVTLICDKCARNPDNTSLATVYKMVDLFAKAMKAELRVNQHKGMRANWLARDLDRSLLELHYHVSKLHYIVMHPDEANECGCDLYDKDHEDQNCSGADLRLEYAADVANCALQLVDIIGLLNPGENRPDLPNPLWHPRSQEEKQK